MSSIFLSYRRNPHGTTVAAIADGLQRYFGTEEVFIDTGIPSGDQYPETLEKRLQDCTVLIAVVHEGWEDTFKEPHHKDWVLHEIKTALDRKIHVIPVPIGNARTPEWSELPAEISTFAHRQAAPIRPATYAADLENLIHQLRKHVAPAAVPSENPEPRPKRVWPRALTSAAALFVLTPIFFYHGGTPWELFAFPASTSTVMLALVSTLTAVFSSALQPWAGRWERTAGIRGIRKTASRYWIVPALVIFLSFTPSIHQLTNDDGFFELNLFFLTAFFLIALWVLWFWFQRTAEREEQWPPPVTTEHAVFRRAAHRLEQRLTENKRSRTKADQQDAELVLARLDCARKDLDHRAGVSFPKWVRSGYRYETIGYLSWFASIVVLDLTATAISVFGEPPLGRSLRVAGLTIAIAAAFTTAVLFVNHRLDRQNARRWSGEITERRERLATMAREHGGPAEPERR